MSANPDPESDRELVSTRVIDFPRELVYTAFSDPVALAVWWGPAGFSSTFQEFELRPGGVWRFLMHRPDGNVFENESVFLEVAAPERIVFRHLRPMHEYEMTMPLFPLLSPFHDSRRRVGYEHDLHGSPNDPRRAGERAGRTDARFRVAGNCRGHGARRRRGGEERARHCRRRHGPRADRRLDDGVAELEGRRADRAITFSFAMVALLLAIIYLGLRVFPTSPWFFVATSTIWTGVLLAGLFRVSRKVELDIARIRVETGTEDEAYARELATRGLELSGPIHRESKARFLGIPLYSCSSSWLGVGPYQSPAARAWIAIGDVAISPLLAIGGLAIAPVAIGGLTVGVISIGGVAVGLLALGSLAAGWWAFGPMAVAWKAAAGGVAIAHDYAVGGLVRAAEANTAVAADWFRAQWFTPAVGFFFGRVAVWLILLSIVVPLGLIAHRAWRIRR